MPLDINNIYATIRLMKNKRFVLRLTEELHEAVNDEAWKTRRSMNQLINDILEEHFTMELKHRFELDLKTGEVKDILRKRK